MSLYPTTIIDRDTATSAPFNEVRNGGLVAIPVEIAPGEALRVLIVHAAATQDHSLRCFLSDAPGGMAVGVSPPSANYWHANRLPDEPVIVAADDCVLPDTTIPAIVVAPGAYYINVLNLVNTSNAFAMSLLDI